MASLSDFATGETVGTKTNRSSNLLLILKAQEAQYEKKYGHSPDKYRALGTSSLLAADLAESYAKNATTEMQLSQAKAQREEFDQRGNKLLSLMDSQKTQVIDAQKSAYLKGGVKLEGSALNVLTDTIIQSDEAQLQKKRELDYQKSQMKIQENMAQSKLDNSNMETLINLGATYAYANIR